MAVATPANAYVIGECTIKANNPHPSTHVNGTINAQGTVACSVVMNEIYLRAVLERADGASWTGTTSDYFGVKGTQANAATSCSAGESGLFFRLRIEYVLQAPPGVDPAYASNTIYSPWVSGKCTNGANRVATGTELDGLTVTVPIEASGK
ncbi:hypothetical protein [Microbacterium sp. SLBN-111]|uniref:hypothetical protein n=1 Tax=Microbacterium sp. SLBN-111 TaxID=3377733 RepID=UPI003C76D3D6